MVRVLLEHGNSLQRLIVLDVVQKNLNTRLII